MSIAPHAEERPATRERSGFLLRRVKIRNYKSIQSCDVELGPFTILVGRNGAGKSNFLNALRLVTEGMREPELQGSWEMLPWTSVADPDPRSIPESRIRLDIELESGEDATYEVALVPAGSEAVVVGESLTIREHGEVTAHYRCALNEVVESSMGFMPPGQRGRFYLVRAAAVPEFRPVYDALTSSAFYDLAPDTMRRMEERSPGTVLARDGSNIASIYASLQREEPTVRDRVVSYLSLVVPEFAAVRHEPVGPFSTLIFERHEGVPSGPRSFYALGVSDGTLRALGILVAINQLANDGRPIRLVGIEEPETALHPAAAAALLDAFREAARHTQILVTTHSADFLDLYDPEEDRLLLATMSGGATRIAPIDEASRTILRKHLDTAGGLLRMDQLAPDLEDLERQGCPPEPAGESGDV